MALTFGIDPAIVAALGIDKGIVTDVHVVYKANDFLRAYVNITVDDQAVTDEIVKAMEGRGFIVNLATDCATELTPTEGAEEPCNG